MDQEENFQSVYEVTKFSRLSRQDKLSTENLELNFSSCLDLYEYQKIDTQRRKRYSKNRESSFHKQNMGTDIHKSHSEPDLCKFNVLKPKESNEQLSDSPSSSRSSDPCDNILNYVEDMLNYKHINKGMDNLQKLNEKLYQESLANAVAISETEFKSTEIYSNKQYCNPNLDTYSEDSKSKTSNINIVITSDNVSPYCDPEHTDNYFTTTETEVKSDNEPMDYKLKSVHEEQIHDKKIGLDTLETTDTVGGTHLNKQFDANFHKPSIKLNTSNFTSPSCLSTETMSTSAKPLVNSQPSTPNMKTSPYVVKKSPSTAVTKTPNKSNKYHYIESPVAAYIHQSPLVPLVREFPAKKQLPSNSRKLKEVTEVKPIKPNKKYHYIQSPVAAYIKNSPQVPLVKAVDPKTELPSTSRTLPQITVSEAIESSDKENINLPLVAHKSSKETTVIEIPDKNKLP